MDATLPVFKHKNEIVSAVHYNDTVIITAETGSGKSTQIPQYLYEAGYDVIVTQPRRIACVSLAEHVSEEMGGSLVPAYQTAFESNRTPMAHIVYCTDGLQLARGIEDVDKTILILDEVHEWNLYIETLIGWVKKFRAEGNRIKIVIMSATMDANSLKEYYDGDAEIINLSEREFPVEKFECRGDAVEQTIMESVMDNRNVLAFLPGKKEIDEAEQTIRNLLRSKKISAAIYQLHGDMLIEQQQKVFEKTDLPKIVLATNIAQTSLTIPDIDDVVDCGKAKIARTVDGFDGLETIDISKADIAQRAGRAGRTKPGRYFLCSWEKEANRPDFGEPEICRVGLDKVVLRLAAVGIDATKMQFFHKPPQELLNEAMDTLVLVKAIEDNTITELGKRLISIPVSIEAGLMLIKAEQYGIETVKKAVECAAILQSGSLLAFGKNKKTYPDFTKRHDSDLLAEVDIFEKHRNDSVEQLESIGLRPKIMLRANEYVEKLTGMIPNILDVADAKYDPQSIFACIAYGLIRNFAIHECYETNLNGEEVLVPHESCVYVPRYYPRYNRWNDYGYDEDDEDLDEYEEEDDDDETIFLVGVPKAVKRSGKHNLTTLLTMVTVIPEDIISDVLEEVGTEQKIEKSTVLFCAEWEQFTFNLETYFRNQHIDTERKEVKKGDEGYEELLAQFPAIVAEAPNKHVVINGKMLPIRKVNGYKTIPLSKEQAFALEGIDEIRNANGELLHLQSRMNGMEAFTTSVAELKKMLTDACFLGQLFNGEQRTFRTANLHTERIASLLERTGKKEITFNGETRVFFVGLKKTSKKNKDAVKLEIFPSEEEATRSTGDILRPFVEEDVRKKYFPRRLFEEGEGEDRCFTERSKEICFNFRQKAQELLANATTENLSSILSSITKEYMNARRAVGRNPNRFSECKR